MLKRSRPGRIATAIAQITGYDIMTANRLLKRLPQTLPAPLHKHQALRLVQELENHQAQAQIAKLHTK